MLHTHMRDKESVQVHIYSTFLKFNPCGKYWQPYRTACIP